MSETSVGETVGASTPLPSVTRAVISAFAMSPASSSSPGVYVILCTMASPSASESITMLIPPSAMRRFILPAWVPSADSFVRSSAIPHTAKSSPFILSIMVPSRLVSVFETSSCTESTNSSPP